MRLARRYLVDGSIAIALTAAALTGALRAEEAYVTRSLDAVGVLLVCGVTLPLAARRARPRGVVVVTVGCTAAGFVGGFPIGIAPLAAIFALWSLAYTTSRRDTVLLGIPASLTLVGALVAAPAELTESELASNVLVTAFALLVGDLMRARKDQNALLGERNRELESLRETEKRSAVVEERMRVAREVHDIVGHSLVAITLQARAGLRRVSRSPARAGEALREIEDLAVAALEETRTAVAAIRSDGDGSPRHRPPTLADIPALVDTMRAPDLDVDLSLDQTAHDLPAPLQAAAYRIVQESLSNVAKHARPAESAVRLGHEREAFVIEVTDNGASAARAVEGSGLRGMRERAHEHGGTLEAGPAPAGGWRVRATFPLEDVPTWVSAS